MYSETVMKHFENPQNVGEMDDADGIGEVGNPACGDIMKFFIKVKDDHIEDIKFLTFGCGAAIAVSSMVSEMAKGKTLDEALHITRDQVAENLGGLPKKKMHCSNLGADALHRAIDDYKNKKYGTPLPEYEEHDHDEEHETQVDAATGKLVHCPYCDVENPLDILFCKACGKKI